MGYKWPYWWLVLNPGPLEAVATILPTVPQRVPKQCLFRSFMLDLFWFVEQTKVSHQTLKGSFVKNG